MTFAHSDERKQTVGTGEEGVLSVCIRTYLKIPGEGEGGNPRLVMSRVILRNNMWVFPPDSQTT